MYIYKYVPIYLSILKSKVGKCLYASYFQTTGLIRMHYNSTEPAIDPETDLGFQQTAEFAWKRHTTKVALIRHLIGNVYKGWL